MRFDYFSVNKAQVEYALRSDKNLKEFYIFLCNQPFGGSTGFRKVIRYCSFLDSRITSSTSRSILMNRYKLFTRLIKFACEDNSIIIQGLVLNTTARNNIYGDIHLERGEALFMVRGPHTLRFSFIEEENYKDSVVFRTPEPTFDTADTTKYTSVVVEENDSYFTSSFGGRYRVAPR